MDRFNFEQVQQRLKQTKRELLVLLANQAQNYFLRGFKTSSFGGDPWEEVQRRKEGTKAYKYPKGKGLQRRTSPILVGAGYKIRGGGLRRDVSTMANRATFMGSRIKMSITVPYASFINEGTEHMPRRRFVGQTPELTLMQQKKINEIVSRIWRA